jgi:tRNASer (uridine44-2'-O)-methyltransferase
LGAGNGFLVYLLTMEGYSGYGIDIRKRDIWDKYPPEVRLVEEPIYPESSVYEVDYIIANHSDELTPWVPLIAFVATFFHFSIFF